jgi:RNA polymerase sigma-70 factor (ECF subfamily)
MSALDHLLCRCQQGDLAAFSELFCCFQDRVYRLAVTILRDEHEAEDITQEVFLRLFRQINSYREEAAFSTWLTAITVNACRDRLRRQKLRQALPLEWLRGRAQRVDSAEMVEQRQLKRSLWEQVDRLEDKYRLPVILFYYEGLPADEVAQMLGLKISAVYARLNTARVRLRAVLQETEDLEVKERQARPC